MRKNIVSGLTKEAMNHLKKNAKSLKFNMPFGLDKHFFESVIIGRVGPNKQFKLNRYKMKDESYSEEFLQMTLPNNNGQNVYFIGLKCGDTKFIWTTKEMIDSL